MQKPLSEYINQFFPPFLFCYRKRFSTQTALVWLIEKWERTMKIKLQFGLLFIGKLSVK